MHTKQNVAILVGGIGEESPISLSSGRFIFENFPKDVGTPFIIFLHKDLSISIFSDYSFCDGEGTLLTYNSNAKKYSIHLIKSVCADSGFDSFVVLPMVHGLGCEDGQVLSLFECLDIQYAGFDSRSSVLTFDKVLSKLVLKDKGFSVLDYNWFYKGEIKERPFENQVIYIKPSRQGSSVGVNRVEANEDFQEALKDAFLYDDKVLVEPECKGREIECAVIQIGGTWYASPIGELTFNESFYSFEAKYKSAESKASLVNLDEKLQVKIQDAAIKVVQALGGKGFARVDFFLQGEKFYVNEVNSLPGMTPISMFPVLISHLGISSQKMIKHLVEEIYI